MDHVIRLIVKGEDFGSQISEKVARKVVRDNKKIQDSVHDLRAEFDLLTNSVIQFGDAVQSKAVTPKGFAKAAGVPLSEMPDDRARQILVAKRFLKGDLQGADRARLAKEIGIPEAEVARWEDNLKRVLDLYEKINEEAVGTKAKSPLEKRAKALLGVGLEDEERVLKAKRGVATATETIKGLNTQISETTDRLEQLEQRGNSLKKILRDIGEVARGELEIRKRGAEDTIFGRQREAQRDIFKPFTASQGDIESFRTAWRAGMRPEMLMGGDSHQVRLLRQLIESQDKEAAYAENQARSLEKLTKGLAQRVSEGDFKQRIQVLRQELFADEKRRPFAVGKDRWTLDDLLGRRRLALPRGWDNATSFTRDSLGAPWRPSGLGKTTFEGPDVQRGPLAISPTGEVSPTGKIKAALDSLDEFFRGQRIRKALDAFEMLASESRKRLALEHYLDKQLEETYGSMGRFNRTIGQLTKGFFSLSAWQDRMRREAELNFLISKKKNAIEYRELVRRESDLFITDKKTGRRRAPSTEVEWDELGEQNKLMLQATRAVRHWSREAKVAEKDVRSFGNAFWVAGAKVRNFVNSANQLVNARWLFIITLWTTFVTVLIQLGVALVEVGSSAIKAGAALGGAFTAGVLQAVSVVGLLRAALSRISEVFSLAEEQDKLRIRSSTDAKAQAEAEANAQDNLTDALEEQQDAVKDLAQARKDARRALVDSAMAEKDAILSVAEAELAVVQAKERLLEIERKQTEGAGNLDFLKGQVAEAQRRLELAQAQGQEAEIAAASHQLAIAQQNLGAFLDQAESKTTELKDAQLGAERAALNLQQARITANRAKADNTEAQKKGVEGSDQVVAALERVEDATKGVADAQNALADAYAARTAAQQALKDKLADLTAAERGLFDTVVKLREEFRSVFRPITDIIVSAFDKGLQKAAILMRDPGIINAAKGLSSQIGVSINRIADFAASKETRNAIAFFTREAAKNLPTVTDALLNIAKAFMRIGIAASPILRNLLARFEGLTERFEKWSRNTKNVENFLSSASKHLNTWIELGKVIARLLYVVGGAAAPEGKTFLDTIIGDLNAWIDKLEANRAGVQEFFREARINLEQFLAIVLKLLRSIFTAFTSEGAEQFVQLIAEVLVPALGQAVYFLGILSGLMLKISKIPFAKEVIAFGFAWGIFTRVIPALRNLDALLVKIISKLAERRAFQTFGERLIAGASNIGRSIIGSIDPAKLKQARTGITGITAALRGMTAAQIAANAAALANPYVAIGAAIVAIIAALVIAERKWHIVTRAFNAFKDAASAVVSFFRRNWKTFVVAAFIGPVAFIIRFRKEIVSTFAKTLNAVTRFVNYISKINLGRIFDRLAGEIGSAIGRIVSELAKLPDTIRENFDKLPGIIGSFAAKVVTAAYNLGRDIVRGIADGIMSLPGILRDSLWGLVDGAINFVKDALAIGSPSRYTMEHIGKPIGEGIKEGAIEGVSGMGAELNLALSNELKNVESQIGKLKIKMLDQVDDFKYLVEQQFDSRLLQEVPADVELRKLDEQEAARARNQQLQQAASEVTTAKKEQEKANNAVIAARKKLKKAKTQEAKAEAKEELTTAKQNQKLANQNLENALKAQRETQHQAWVEQERARLLALRDEQRKALDQSVAAEKKRALELITQFANTLKGEPNKAKITKARKILDQIIALIGGGKEGGKNAANEYIDGFLQAVSNFEKQFNKQEKNLGRKAGIEAAKNKRAAGLLEQATGRVAGGEMSSQELISSLRHPKRGKPKSDSEILQYLIETGNIDLPLALAIVEQTPDLIDQKILTKMFKSYKKARKLSQIALGLEKDASPGVVLETILRKLKPQEGVLQLFANALKDIPIFHEGGTVRGGSNSAVPIIAHAGEWVLNKAQQQKLSKKLGNTVEETKAFLFGSKMSPEQYQSRTAGTKKGETRKYETFSLVEHEDDYGQMVYFIEFDDGFFGQIRKKDAMRVIKSGGQWVPGYVRRNKHGFTASYLDFGPWFELANANKKKGQKGSMYSLARGGVVLASMAMSNPRAVNSYVQSYADGGVVTASPSGVGSSNNVSKTVNQNFNVRTEGETDWNYVMRLGAINALG